MHFSIQNLLQQKMGSFLHIPSFSAPPWSLKLLPSSSWVLCDSRVSYFSSKCTMHLRKSLLLSRNLGTGREGWPTWFLHCLEALMQSESCYSRHSAGASEDLISIWGQWSMSSLRNQRAEVPPVTDNYWKVWLANISEPTKLLSP